MVHPVDGSKRFVQPIPAYNFLHTVFQCIHFLKIIIYKPHYTFPLIWDFICDQHIMNCSEKEELILLQ